MTSPITVTSGLWALWLLSWLLAAAWSAPAVARQPVSERLMHITLLSAGAILLFGHSAPGAWWQRPLLPPTRWLGWAAVAAAALGFACTWWARLHLGRLWSGNVTLKAGHAVVSTGPYRLTRHPIYTGLLLAVAATAVIQNEPAAFAALGLILGGLLVKIRQEERLLAAHLGAAYAAYRAEVPALIPRLW